MIVARSGQLAGWQYMCKVRPKGFELQYHTHDIGKLVKMRIKESGFPNTAP